MRSSPSGIRWKDGKPDITVQVLARHPNIATAMRWAHNLLEQEPTNLTRYNNQPKPAGWGNGGGGLEPDDIQNLAQLFPDHPILTDSFLSEDQRLIIAGGIREFTRETGYGDTQIITDYPGVFLYDYKYSDWSDAKGVVYLGGHRKITLWGQITSFNVYEDLRTERHEVDKTDWIDLAESLPKIFFNRLTHPDWPYWSHVRSSLIGLLRIYRHLRFADTFVEDIPRKIHPSWWSIFQVGKGDSRFPVEGYKLSPSEWYDLFKMMVSKRMEFADNDFLIRFLGKDLGNAMRKEEKESGAPVSDAVPQELPNSVTEVVQDSEDSEGVPTVEAMRRQEDQEYGEWFEETLPLHQRVILV